MGESVYEQVGGEPFFAALTADFYRGVAEDPVLRPMYVDQDLTEAEHRLRLFLMQYWGGPGTYQELRGHPRLRMRHAPFPVDPTARDHWLECMARALAARAHDPEPLPPELAAQLWSYFTMAADAMINSFGN